MTFEHPGGAALDYELCRYGQSRLLCRGPKERLAPPYTVFFGGTETYGRFVPRPFPQLLADRLALRTVNFGCINGGIDVIASDPVLLSAAEKAETRVIQVLGAHNLSNPFYSVHPRRNDRFVAATTHLQDLYPDVDFTEFSFTRHLLETLERRDAERFGVIVHALKETWVARMQDILKRIGQPVLLLWIARAGMPRSAGSILRGSDPLFVDEAMIARLTPLSTGFIQVLPSRSARAVGTEGMIFSEFEGHIAGKTMNAATHAEVADALMPVLIRAAAA